MSLCWFFFFKESAAFELGISDWSSDVCSSDLHVHPQARRLLGSTPILARQLPADRASGSLCHSRMWRRGGLGRLGQKPSRPREPRDRQSAGKGKSVSVSVDLGGADLLKKKNTQQIKDSKQTYY